MPWDCLRTWIWGEEGICAKGEESDNGHGCMAWGEAGGGGAVMECNEELLLVGSFVMQGTSTF